MQDITEETSSQDTFALVLASFTARIWLAVRAVQTGIEKFADTKAASSLTDIDGEGNDYGLTDAVSEKFYALSNNHGIPNGLRETFDNEPLVSTWGLIIMDKTLGPILIILGLGILLGIASRSSLFLLGLVYSALTWGLVLLGEPGNSGSAWLAAHVLVILFALLLTRYDKFRVLKKW